MKELTFLNRYEHPVIIILPPGAEVITYSIGDDGEVGALRGVRAAYPLAIDGCVEIRPDPIILFPSAKNPMTISNGKVEMTVSDAVGEVGERWIVVPLTEDPETGLYKKPADEDIANGEVVVRRFDPCVPTAAIEELKRRMSKLGIGEPDKSRIKSTNTFHPLVNDQFVNSLDAEINTFLGHCKRLDLSPVAESLRFIVGADSDFKIPYKVMIDVYPAIQKFDGVPQL